MIAIPYINGRSIIEIVKDVELNYEADIAGAYDGIRPDMLLRELRNGSIHDTNKSKILECDCGVDGCWPLLMRVSQDDYMVTWSDFVHIHRDRWDYSSLGTFRFSSDQYLKVLDILTA